MDLLLKPVARHPTDTDLEHRVGEPSAWVRRWSHLVCPGGEVLDVACGQGRHMQWFSSRGHPVTGIDRNAQALQCARQFGTVVEADVEQATWPLLHDGVPRRFSAVVVTHYLWRPLWPTLLLSLQPGGLLLYETFAEGNGTFGKPSRPDFLLQRDELLRRCSDLHIVAYENGFLAHPPRLLQRIAAQRPGPDAPWSHAPPSLE